MSKDINSELILNNLNNENVPKEIRELYENRPNFILDRFSVSVDEGYCIKVMDYAGFVRREHKFTLHEKEIYETVVHFLIKSGLLLMYCDIEEMIMGIERGEIIDSN
jgi:hypothetical protein